MAAPSSASRRARRALFLMVRSPGAASARVLRAARRRARRFGRLLTGNRHLPASTPSLPAATVGKAVAGPVLSRELPVYAYLAFGLPTESLCALARVARQSAHVLGDHVPLIMTDSGSFPLFRETRVPVEYVPDRDTWHRHRDDESWERFRSRRLARLLRVHQPSRVVVVDATDPIDLPHILGKI